MCSSDLILDNALSLQLTMPNLRRHGVLETRAPDSMDDIKTLEDTAARYHGFAYDAQKRAHLLANFHDVAPEKLKEVFLNRFALTEKALMAQDIGGSKTVADLVMAVRADMPQPQAKPAAHARQRKNQKGLQQGDT